MANANTNLSSYYAPLPSQTRGKIPLSLSPTAGCKQKNSHYLLQLLLGVFFLTPELSQAQLPQALKEKHPELERSVDKLIKNSALKTVIQPAKSGYQK
jgi:hypothetical protein